jgi:hypothetical protein
MSSLITAIADPDWSKGEPELHFVQLFCCDTGEFLDVGANTGVYSAVAARYARRVVAMEPNPDVAGNLCRALPSNVEVIAAAASDQTIDSLKFEHLTAIKLDVAGHEFAALHGAAETISRFRPSIIVVCEERHNAGGVAQLIEFFSARDYSGFFFHRDRLVPIAEFDISRLQNNNFIFLPHEATTLIPRLQSIASDLGIARNR